MSSQPANQVDPVESYRRAVNPYRYEVVAELDWPWRYDDARGEHVTSSDGRQFLDLVAGYGTATLGHRHPRVVTALTAALEQGGPFVVPIGLPGRSGELAERLCALAGADLERTYFCSTGAEAVEVAMKFAMAATGRDEFVSFHGGYHGLTTGALGLAGDDFWRLPLPSWMPAGRHRLPFGDVDRLDAVLAGDTVAAVVLEPVQGLGGARAWSPEDLRAVAQICAAHGSLLVVDEVLTGIGRTGRWFGFQHAGISPDVVVVSKGLSGGAVPVAAVLMTRAVHQAVYSELGRATIHSSTFEGHLLGMVAGLAVLDVVESERLVERALLTGRWLGDELDKIRAEDVGLTGVRGQGLLLAFQVEGFDEADDPDGALTLMQLLLDRRVLVYPAAHDQRWLKLTPPLNLSEASIDRFLDALRAALTELADLRTA